VDRRVADVHGAVGTHGQRLADGVGGRVRTDGQDGDRAAVRLLDRQRLLDGVLVHLVDDVVGGGPDDRVVLRVQRALAAGIGDLLDQNDDLHRQTNLRGSGSRGAGGPASLPIIEVTRR
jgi:hypothetical protein